MMTLELSPSWIGRKCRKSRNSHFIGLAFCGYAIQRLHKATCELAVHSGYRSHWLMKGSSQCCGHWASKWIPRQKNSEAWWMRQEKATLSFYVGEKEHWSRKETYQHLHNNAASTCRPRLSFPSHLSLVHGGSCLKATLILWGNLVRKLWAQHRIKRSFLCSFSVCLFLAVAPAPRAVKTIWSTIWLNIYSGLALGHPSELHTKLESLVYQHLCGGGRNTEPN